MSNASEFACGFLNDVTFSENDDVDITKLNELYALVGWDAEKRTAAKTMEMLHVSHLGFNSQVQRAVGRIPEKVNGNQDTFWDDD